MVTDQNSVLVLLANQVIPLHTSVIERLGVLGCSRVETPYPYLFGLLGILSFLEISYLETNFGKEVVEHFEKIKIFFL